jgi:acetyl esterase/lipase
MEHAMKPLDLSPEATWRKRFTLPVVPMSQLAGRNKSRGLVTSNKSGVFQLHTWNVETGETHQITDTPVGVVFGGISPDGKYIYYHKDEGGNEIGHFVRVPFEGGEPEDISPDLPLYSSFSLTQSLNGALLGFSTAGQDGFTMYGVAVSPDGTLGERKKIYNSKRLTSGPVLSADGSHAVIDTTERSQNMNMTLLAFRLATGEMFGVQQDADASLHSVAFSPIEGDQRLLATTNITGFVRPMIWDMVSGDRTDMPFVGMDGDIYASAWSPDAKRLLLTQFVQAQYQLHIYDIESATLTPLKHPTGTFSGGYFYDDSTIFVHHQDALHPTQLVALDAATGEQKRVVLTAAEAPPSRPWRSVMFPGANGEIIQGWLCTPEGTGPWPTILETHGGPTAVQTETFKPNGQAWVDHGFAFFSLNYHGSVTFGRQFEQSIYGQLGELEAEDMKEAYYWLVNNHIAKPDEVLLTGGSYGGYLTLLGLGKHPKLWAGGMAVVAIADWKLMYEDQAETLRGYQRSLFGGTPDDMPEQHAKSSPITYAEDVKAPVLVIQGENDTRCPARQMHAYEDKLKSCGKEIVVEWFDAGHGSRAMDESMKQMETMLRWAYRILG